MLNVANNPIGDAGAEALASSRALAGLIELDLSDAGIGDAGAVALAESPYLDGLLRLVVRSHGPTARRLGAEARSALLERFGERVTL